MTSHWRAHPNEHMLTRWILLTFVSFIPPRLPTVSIPLRLTISDIILSIPFRIAHRLTWATTQHPTIPFWASDSMAGLLWHVATKKEIPRLDPSNLLASRCRYEVATLRTSTHDLSTSMC